MAHYVSNADFLAAIVEMRAKVEEAKAKGLPKPIVSNYIGECILKIATHLSYKPNFIGYSYREEMISDGIENCLQYIGNFDPDKSSNPFAYFTQIIYYAFLRRIAKEKKQTYIKGKIILDMPYDTFEEHGADGGSEFKNQYAEFLQSNHQLDDYFDRKAEKRKKKRADVSLETFLDSDDIVHDESDLEE